MHRKLLLALSLAVSQSVFAQGFQQENAYAGAGLNLNSISNADDAVGYQFFGGYEFAIAEMRPATLALELGFFESGDFESDRVGTEFSADGLWANAVFGYPIAPQLSLIGRAGLDFGDDDGLMFGGGVGFAIAADLELRGEVVARDEIDSIQANMVYRF